MKFFSITNPPTTFEDITYGSIFCFHNIMFVCFDIVYQNNGISDVWERVFYLGNSQIVIQCRLCDIFDLMRDKGFFDTFPSKCLG